MEFGFEAVIVDIAKLSIIDIKAKQIYPDKTLTTYIFVIFFRFLSIKMP